MDNRRKGPSCFGAILVFCAIVVILKFAYSVKPEEVVSHDPYESAEELYDIILEELAGYSTELTFDFDCVDRLYDTFDRVRHDHPELFWVRGSGHYKMMTEGEKVSVVFEINNDMTLVDILKCQNELNRVKHEILSSMDESLTDYEKLLYIHDYIVKNTEYDSETADKIIEGDSADENWLSRTAYGCLVNRSAVCSGYAAAFQLLTKELGFDCIRVTGLEKESGVGHEWNCIRYGEKWYYVDVTWDDPVYKSENSYFDDSIPYEYFMISEEMLTVTHEIDEGQSVPICGDETMNYYRRFGRYLEDYSYEETVEVLRRQLDRDVMEIMYGSTEIASRAVQDLFEEYRFYEMEEIASLGKISLSYIPGKNGLVRIKIIE